VRRLLTIPVLLMASFRGHAQEKRGQPGLPNLALAYVNGGDSDAELTYEIAVQKLVPNGNYVFVPEPSCGATQANPIETVMAGVSAVVPKTPVSLAALSIAGFFASGLDERLAQEGGVIAQLTRGDGHATCALLTVTVPKVSHITEVMYFVGDGDAGTARCSEEGNRIMTCGPIGYLSWGRPSDRTWDEQRKTNKDPFVAAALFRNWSHDRARWASMLVRFRVPKTPHWDPQAFYYQDQR
jgi:hypothetical protein